MTDLIRCRLSPEQRRAWARGHDDPAYASQIVVRPHRAATRAAWARALELLVARHEILRTSFAAPDGFHVPQQVVGAVGHAAPSRRVVYEECALEAWCAADRAAVTAASVAVPWRVSWVRQDDRELLIATAAAWAADLWSVALVVDELLERATAPASNYRDTATLPYRQYAEWRNAHAGSRSAGLQATPFASMPFRLDRAGPLTGRLRRRPVTERLDAAALSRLATDCRATLADVVAACLAIVAWRYTGAPRIAFGRMHDRRIAPGARRALGLYAAAQPLDLELAAADDLASVIEQVAIEWTAQRSAGGERFDAPHAPLLLEHVEWPDGLSRDAGHGAVIEHWSCVEPFDIKVESIVDADGLSAAMVYAEDAFDSATVDVFADALRGVLTTAAEQSRRPVAQLTLGTPVATSGHAEQRSVVVGPAARFVHELIASSAETVPSHCAVACADERLSYRELNRRANAVASALRRAGAGPDVVVPVVAARSIDAVIAIVGVLKSGAAYAPFDPGHTRAWFEQRPATGPVLVASRALATSLGITECVCVDEVPDETVSAATPPALHPENLAYVLFTSGTTGEPKGVAVEHRQFSAYVAAVSRLLAVTADTRFAMASTFATDLAHTAVFPTLCSRGTLDIVPDRLLLDPIGFRDYVARHQVDGLKMTPSHWHALASAADDRSSLLPRRCLVVGGELCYWDQFDAARVGGCRIFNHYGPTETTVVVSSHELGRESARYSATVPIGSPLPNVRAFVLSADGMPLARGEVGELFIGGPSVTRGYLASPDRTAERFVPDPFDAAPGARMYRTGDRARWLPDGRLECLGRVDGQVKVRGFRVEVGEVETVLRSHPAIQHAVVVPIAAGRGDVRLVAHAVPMTDDESGRPVFDSELRPWLAARLAPAAIPSAFTWVRALPRTASGKVDRRALAGVDAAPGVATSTPASAPAGDVEEALAALWSGALGGRPVGRHDDFFRSGGHSLLAIRLLARVGVVFQRSIAPNVLFGAATVAAFARWLGDDATTRQLARLYLDQRDGVGAVADSPAIEVSR